MKYKVGDKARVREDLKAGVVRKKGIPGIRVDDEMLMYRGEEVTITVIDADGDYKIREDCGDWFWSDEMLEPIRNEKIVITSDGVTTIARKYDGKKTVKEAKAVCSKDDTFDFDVGAKQAMERLMAEDKPKYYNGKVVCVNTSGLRLYTKGKVYEIKEGRFAVDNGMICPNLRPAFYNFEDFQNWSAAEWLEVVE